MSGEFAEKVSRVRKFMSDMGLDSLILCKRHNLSWLMCGGVFHVAVSTELARAVALVTRDSVKLFTTNNEAGRMVDEELSGLDVELVSLPWYGEPPLSRALKDAGSLGRIGADVDVRGVLNIDSKLASIRFRLSKWEVDRLRNISKTCVRAVTDVLFDARKGETELELAADMLRALASKGFRIPVVLVASEKRVLKYRHPIPKDVPIEKYAVVSVVAEAFGLHVSLTRSIYFGQPPADLLAKHRAVSEIAATFIEATKPGVAGSSIFKAGVKAYRRTGFPEEWRSHHQGGWIAYKPRELIATWDISVIVEKGHAFAWNPTIAGVKSEDTIVVAGDHAEVLTQDNRWPYDLVEIQDTSVAMPQILELA